MAFEDVEALDRTLRAIIGRERDAGHTAREICIDVTGGQKPTSIAGALATLNNSVTIQYVQTGGSKEVHIRDLRWHFPGDEPHEPVEEHEE